MCFAFPKDDEVVVIGNVCGWRFVEEGEEFLVFIFFCVMVCEGDGGA